ncbi:MAG: hypothetical protein QM598_05820 [Protaetiibacter sp.]
MRADTPNTGAKHLRFARARAVLVALVLALVPAIAPLVVPSAAAASHGPGYDQGLGWLGAYREGGQNVYCLEQPLNPPLNTTASYAGAWAWGGLSTTDAARLNWAISGYGQSTDRRWTAAVQLYVWSLADPTYNSHGMSGDTYFVGRAPASEQPLIRANLATIRAGASGIFAGSTSGTATGTFQVDPLNNYLGTLTVSVSPTNMTGSITLTNGIFLSTGTNTIAGVTHGQVLQVRGVPTPDGEPYKISAAGTFTGSFAYGGAIGVWATPGLQTLGGPGPQGAPVAQLSAIDPMFRASDFVPELTSTVSDQVLAPGDAFCDNFTFAAGLNPEAGSVVPWLQDAAGAYAPITASVTLYRIFTRPVPGAAIPAEAIEVETFTITTSTASGPTVPYPYCTGPLTEGGYYVAVSTIRSDDQLPGVQLYIPTDYEWTDGWGVPAETAVLMHPARSEATPEAIVGQAVTDTVFFPDFVPNLSWISWEIYKRPEGAPAPLESDDPEAIDPAAVCTPETLYTTLSRNDHAIAGSTMRSPDGWSFGGPGVYDWVVVIREGGPSGPEVWRADCGVVSERTIVHQVAIVTEAQSSSTWDGAIADVATVDGLIEAGDVLTFRAYTPSTDAAGAPVCDAAHLLWESEAIEIEPGVYTAERVESGPTTVGGTRVWWVETLEDADGAIVHQGACGLETETSRRPAPPLPHTGADGDSIGIGIWIGAGVAMLGTMLLVVASAWRRRRTAR